MMTIIAPYHDSASLAQESIAETIRGQCPQGKLINLDLMLLHSPALATGYNAVLPKIRNELNLPTNARELAICATAGCTGADYELHHHASPLVAAVGTLKQLKSLKQFKHGGMDHSLFNESEAKNV